MSEANTMTQDEIIDMAETAGMTRDGDMWFSNGKSDMDVHIIHLEAFAKLVDAKATAREREACAKLAETPIGEYEVVVACGTEPTPHRIHRYLDSDSIAKAIRNRGDL